MVDQCLGARRYPSLFSQGTGSCEVPFYHFMHDVCELFDPSRSHPVSQCLIGLLVVPVALQYVFHSVDPVDGPCAEP